MVPYRWLAAARRSSGCTGERWRVDALQSLLGISRGSPVGEHESLSADSQTAKCHLVLGEGRTRLLYYSDDMAIDSDEMMH